MFHTPVVCMCLVLRVDGDQGSITLGPRPLIPIPAFCMFLNVHIVPYSICYAMPVHIHCATLKGDNLQMQQRPYYL
jgi:hypothetical protein